MNCLCIKRGILRPWVSCLLKLRIYRTRWIPCQMRENFMILNQGAALERPTLPVSPPLFWVPRPCLAAILDCRVIHGILWLLQETFLERPRAQEGRISTLFNNSKNLASSSQEVRPDTAGNTKRPESEMRRQPQNSSIPVPRFKSGGGILNHTGGTDSHGGMMDSPRFLISELHLGKFPASVEFQSW